jgi:hypothetical protein
MTADIKLPSKVHRELTRIEETSARFLTLRCHIDLVPEANTRTPLTGPTVRSRLPYASPSVTALMFILTRLRARSRCRNTSPETIQCRTASRERRAGLRRMRATSDGIGHKTRRRWARLRRSDADTTLNTARRRWFCQRK